MSGLLEDHELILNALRCFSNILDKYGTDLKASEEDLLIYLEKLTGFIENVHQVKEEKILFPAMSSKGIPDRGGPVGAMMAEHIQGRGYLQELLEEIDGMGDRQSIEQIGRKYNKLLTEHIRKENLSVFSLAENAFTHEEMENLQVGFKELGQQGDELEKRAGLLELIDKKEIG